MAVTLSQFLPPSLSFPSPFLSLFQIVWFLMQVSICVQHGRKLVIMVTQRAPSAPPQPLPHVYVSELLIKGQPDLSSGIKLTCFVQTHKIKTEKSLECLLVA